MSGTTGTAVAVAAGSNVGDRAAHLAQGLRRLKGVVAAVRCSRVYETRAEGSAAGEAPFLNLCCVGRTEAGPGELLERLLAVEEACGRRRPAPPGAPRELDLDLLLYGDEVVDRPGLRVPHPRMTGRAFVLVPLAEVAPSWRHPETGRTIRDMRREVSDEGVEPYRGELPPPLREAREP